MKLLDFGIARLLDQEDGGDGAAHPMTRAYASPARLAGASPTIADDVFALRTIVHQLLGESRGSPRDPLLTGGALRQQALIGVAATPPLCLASARPASPRPRATSPRSRPDPKPASASRTCAAPPATCCSTSTTGWSAGRARSPSARRSRACRSITWSVWPERERAQRGKVRSGRRLDQAGGTARCTRPL